MQQLEVLLDKWIRIDPFLCIRVEIVLLFAVGLDYRQIDDSATSVAMIGSGISLDEPYLQYRLSILANEERKGLRSGKIPICESFYLIGTADPTGTLNSDEVCIILYEK